MAPMFYHKGLDKCMGKVMGEEDKELNNKQAECAETGWNCGVALNSILAEYKDGNGLGELFNEYGKPDHRGVGHIWKELELVGQIRNENTTRVKNEEKTNNGNAKGKDK